MIRKILLCLLTVIFACSLYATVKEYLEKSQDEAFYESLRTDNLHADNLHAENSDTDEAFTNQELNQSSVSEAAQEAYQMPSNLKALSDNPNIVGWIKIDNSRIDYPIAQSKTDNEYFLHRDIYGNTNTVGCIYLDAINDIDKAGMHLIYGHHIRTGTMFHDIANFTEPEYLQNHQDIIVWTKNREIKLKPLVCYAGSADGEYRQEFLTAEEMQEFIKNKTGAVITSDNVFVLITCSYNSLDERTYLICVEDPV